MIKFCQKCKDNKVSELLCLDGYYWVLLESVHTCKICGNELVDIDFPAQDFKVLYYVSKEPSFIHKMMELREKDIIDYELKMSQFRTQVEQRNSTVPSSANQIKCPRCGSANIQIVPRKWSILTGFRTNKADRICVNCKHKF